jgi:hypothetical protein
MSRIPWSVLNTEQQRMQCSGPIPDDLRVGGVYRQGRLVLYPPIRAQSATRPSPGANTLV